MSPDDGASQILKSGNAQRIAACRANVQSFFSNNWPQLRELIADLKGESECVGVVAEITENSTNGHDQFSTECTTGSVDKSQTVTESLAPRFQERDRLRELTQQIERKLHRSLKIDDVPSRIPIERLS